LRAYASRLPAGVKNVLKPFEPGNPDVEPNGVALPDEPLFPLRIVLPDAATWLAKNADQDGQGLALLRFVAAQPSASKCRLQADTLRALLCCMPFFLLLDGFDEVGAVADRGRIVSVARELVKDLASENANGIILATTRPQGYTDELSGIGIPLAKWSLGYLDSEEALRYAKKLVEAKISGADDQARIFARLQEAATEPATARLLKTPLQVTIMAALVQQGRAPSERWKLFSSYFHFTYRREIERDSYASKLLAERQGHIEEIHRRVALILQVEGEQAGGSARMSRSDLEQLVDVVLKEDEVDDEERSDLRVRIVDAAERRLVFLEEPEPGQFGFEIRSLQEFMAAWALTEGSESAVEARLLQVATAPLFRHVALFMSSRFFTDRSGLRDVLAGRICRELDETPADPVAWATKPGAVLALDILEEGSVSGQPKRERALMEQARELLDLPPDKDHLRLVGEVTPDTAKVLCDGLETRLTQAKADPTQSALTSWLCLNIAASKGLPWANTLAEDWRETLRHPQELVSACNQCDVPLSLWLESKIDGTPELFTPASLLRSRRGEQAAQSQGWVRHFRHSFHSAENRQRIRLSWAPASQLNAVPVSADREGAITFAGRSSTSPVWRIWFAAAAFQCAPSAAALARTLRVIAECWSATDERFDGLANTVSWPLASCLNAALNAAELVVFADIAAAGELGDTADWLAAQQGWAVSSSLLSTLDTVEEERPWTMKSLFQAPPLTALRIHDFFSSLPTTPSCDEVLQLAQTAFENARLAKHREILAMICLLAMRIQPRPTPRQESAWLAACQTTPGLARPSHVSEKEWTRVLNASGTEWALLLVNEALPQSAASHFVDDPKNAGFLYVLTRAMAESSFFETERRILDDALEQRLEETLALHSDERPQAQADAAELRCWLGILFAPEAPLEAIGAVAKSSPFTWGQFIWAIARGRLLQAEREALLLRILERSDVTWNVQAFAIAMLRGLRMNRSRSGLSDPGVWERLGLPLPHPQVPVSALRAITLPDEPVVITELQLYHIRGIHKIELSFAAPEPGHGQWVVFLGPNGAGKTTLLRSLVLALRNLQDPKIWPKGAFYPSWCQAGGPSSASIQVKLANQGATTTRIRANGTESFLQEPQAAMSRSVPLFAYGCRRGSAFGGVARAVDLTDDDGPEVATLFHEGAALIHAETWLIQWAGDQNPQSKRIYDAVRSALQLILDVESIEVSDQKVWVQERGKPKLPFQAQSDGYVTTAGWVIDLVARWIDLAKRYRVPIDEHFCSQMTGLVLIDEIDLYLHPQWQVDVIDRTRKLFPKLSFVVTTHNPLTLVGAKPEEIWILSIEEGRVQARHGQELPMFLTGGQIYSQYFGIRDLYPHELGRKLQRYGFLSGYALRSDKEQAEMETLREELQARGIAPGWEEVPRQSADDEMAVRAPKRAPSRKARGAIK
jgi:energy-coupling factor transporter ATP-binding protein EcfA2